MRRKRIKTNKPNTIRQGAERHEGTRGIHKKYEELKEEKSLVEEDEILSFFF